MEKANPSGTTLTLVASKPSSRFKLKTGCQSPALPFRKHLLSYTPIQPREGKKERNRTMNVFKRTLCVILVTVLLFSTSAAHASSEDFHYLSSNSCVLLDTLIKAGLTTSTFKYSSTTRAAFAFLASWALTLEDVIDAAFISEAALSGNIYIALLDETFILFMAASNRLVVLYCPSDGNDFCYGEFTSFTGVSLSTLIADSGIEYWCSVSAKEFLDIGSSLYDQFGS